MTTTQVKPTEQEWNEVLNFSSEKYGELIPIKNIKQGNYFLEYFTNCLPPIMFSNFHVLCSEPYDHDENGKVIYQGIFNKNGNWYAVKCTKDQFVKLI